MTKINRTFKLKQLPVCIKRQGGLTCYQCNQTILDGNYVFEHLDDNYDNTISTNVAIAHQSCNIKKTINYDMKLKALELKKIYEKMAIDPDDGENLSRASSSEIDINRKCYGYTKQWLTEIVGVDGRVELNDAVFSIIYDCQEKFGAGAESTIRKYVNTLTLARGSQLMQTKDDDGKRWVIKRSGN